MLRTALAALTLGLSTAAMAQAPLPTQAQPYLRAAAQGDIFEITTSQVALLKTQNQAIRDYAMRMITDHTLTTNNALAAAVDANVVPPPAVLDEMQREKVGQLLNASGPQFDRLFWQMQVEAHQKALELQRTYAQSGDTAQLRTFAARAAPVIKNHLEVARRYATR